MQKRLEDHEGSETAAPHVAIHGMADINVPDNAFKAICKVRFENLELDDLSTCNNVAHNGDTGRCGHLQHTVDPAQSFKVRGWYIKIHDAIKKHIARTLRYMRRQVLEECRV